MSIIRAAAARIADRIGTTETSPDGGRLARAADHAKWAVLAYRYNQGPRHKSLLACWIAEGRNYR